MRESNVRRPAVEGMFYPGTPAELSEMIAAWKLPIVANDAELQAVIVPHAGLVYSGRIAMKALLAAAGNDYQRIIVLAPTHRVGFRRIALSSAAEYQTMLGKTPLDTEMAEMLMGQQDVFGTYDLAHAQEHAVEVQQILLQSIWPDGGFKLLPCVVGSLDDRQVREAAAGLAPFLNAETLWVISSDFTHYGRSFGYLPFTEQIPEELKKLDMGAVALIARNDLNGFEQYLRLTGATICGATPIRILLAAAELSGLSRWKFLEYRTSGEMTGDFRHCVSYVSMALDR